MRSFIALVLCICLLAGCAAETVPTATETKETTEPMETTQLLTQPTTEPVTEPEETDPVIPEDGRTNLYYDDRLSLLELTGTQPVSVEIRTEEVTSMQLGTQEPETEVLYYDQTNSRLIAVGCGLATVVADGTEYPVRVSTAPISMFLITGHSLGAGQTGVPGQSVKCEEGQAYSTVLKDNPGFPDLQTGIGYNAPKRPNGIDALTVGGGAQGEAGGLAYRWNQLTGEKIWVINAAVGGSCLNEWVQGEPYFSQAMSLFASAQMTLRNEIKAGHFRLKDYAVVYHSAANFAYKEVSFTNEILNIWYASLLEGLELAAMDLNDDGRNEILDAVGFVPCWTNGATNKHQYDKPANYYMGAVKDYPKAFVASMATRDWCSVQGIADTFPEIDYETHGEPVAMPVLLDDIFSDGTHLTQVAYNAAGMDIAQHFYEHLRTEVTAESVSILTDYFMEASETLKLRVYDTMTLILMPQPFHVSDLKISVTDNLGLEYPFVLYAKEVGTGTVTVSQGDQVLKTITVIVE